MMPFVRILALVLTIALSGCAVQGTAPSQEMVEARGDQFKAQSASKTVNIVNEPYLGAQAKPFQVQQETPALNSRVTLRRNGTLAEIISSLNAVSPDLSVHLADADIADSEPVLAAPSGADPLSLPPLPSTGGGKRLNVSYEGTLRGLLDHIGGQSGYGWDYDAEGNRITFSNMQVRTFTILSAPGTVTYDNQLTNRSRENTNGSLGGGIGQTVTSGDASSQTAQTNTTKLKFDVWEECEKGIKALLSKQGTVVVNQAAGTVTVRDTSSRLRQISIYMQEINERLERQVALTVHVWSLELTDDAEGGLNLQVLFENADIAVAAGNLMELGSASSAAVSIVDGKLKGSSAAVKALRQWGKVTQLTSAGGVLMSNQPLPSLAIKRHAYLASLSLNTNDYGQTSSVTPGEVTTGFAMTVIPHILDKRRVILQYNINLSSLDEMVELKTDDVVVQLPQVSTRSFAQRTTMKMGQTLVLAGFEQESQGTDNSVGLLSGGRKAQYGKTLLVITIELESAEV